MQTGFPRKFDAQADLVTPNFNNDDRNVVVYHECLILSARNDKHDLCFPEYSAKSGPAVSTQGEPRLDVLFSRFG